MLARRIARTAAPHLTLRVSHFPLPHRPLHPRHIITATATAAAAAEPTLNWKSGVDVESEIDPPVKRGRGRPRKYPLSDKDIVKRARDRPRKPAPEAESENPTATAVVQKAAPKRAIRPQEEEEEESIPEPVLDWVSGHRTTGGRAAESRSLEPDAIEEPRFNWLPPHREAHAARPAWQGSIRERLSADPATLLAKALGEVTRRRRTRPAEPDRDRVTRYPLFDLPPTAIRSVARKVISKHRNASEGLTLSKPSITIGKTRWTAIDPRRVPEGRLRVESFDKMFENPQQGRMDKPMAASEPAAAAVREPVPDDTDIEMPALDTHTDIEISTLDTHTDIEISTLDTHTDIEISTLDTHTNTDIPPTSISTSPAVLEGASNPDLKRVHASPQESQPNKKQRSNRKNKPLKEGGIQELLEHDIKALFAALNITDEANSSAPLPEYLSTLELTIASLTSTGDGLAVHENRAFCVPFTIPGDTVKVKVRNNQHMFTMASLLNIVTPSADRDDSLIKCKYFSSCSGCQFQMLPYEKQLAQKRRVVEKAFANYSDVPAALLPAVLPTMASPLQYGYRTKLTPHFNGPRRGGFKPELPPPNIGFMAKMERFTLDIEDCPIGTDTLREGLKSQREWVRHNLHTYKRGATLLLRESTDRVPVKDAADGKKYVETKNCVTNSKKRSIEYFGDFRFDSPAGSFFQNNNSILEPFTDYIRENLHLPVSRPTGDTTSTIKTTAPKYLVDAYCGSGLFTVACGQGLEKVIGIDIDEHSILSARNNAATNNIQNATFLVGNAEAIFAKITFPGADTSLIIDPPRKGCDTAFLDQLLDFAPKRIVYVSCNVHTQARDVGYILKDDRGRAYTVDSIKGFDFFPQTHHVEGVVVLTRAE